MSDLKRTPLYDAHRALGARMVEFGGWSMPVQYPTGILAEHKAVRERVGLFDVSHMGEVEVRGSGAAQAVQRLVTNDVGALGDGDAFYTVACLPSGGVVDDLIVYRLRADRFLIVVNASNREKDLSWFRENVGTRAEIVDRSDETALLALQGPQAASLLASLWKGPPLPEVKPFSIVAGELGDLSIQAGRTGYTGEDGFELFLAAGDAPRAFERLLAAGAAPCGLGARDTLRLEARLCLYGHELDETTTPLEAGLGWVVRLEAGEFIGKEALLAQQRTGVSRRLCGFVMQERGIARHGYEIFDTEGQPVGRVTSGGPSPSTGQNIGLGYVRSELAAPGQTIVVDCRGKRLRALVRKGAFYKRGKPT